MDYALLELEEDIIQMAKNNHREVSIACLNDSKDLAALAGEACWIAGWGATNSESGVFRHGFCCFDLENVTNRGVTNLRMPCI